MKIDWVRKLTSRKFWTSVSSFVAMLMIYFGAAESEATQVSALIIAGATVIAYVLAEGLTDATNKDVSIEDTDSSKSDS